MNSISHLDMICASVWVDKLIFQPIDAVAFIIIEAKKWRCSIDQVIEKYVTRVCVTIL